ncbi:DUF4342 domain-containing protein [Ovoidimarina sediminis]|uniref:DUF4342 domain-containing protein n=1 Tax=Ovoidimarina sediminis TaxID=3079856 RepID=UPI002906BC7B|nr:DUF4342 domain-containing protein [Rhodophyticola sp. MJ-SS7]MDU8942000.1 DUF4342 domain-containing protein [Rhodophyticola sp. MJ-SS7]
MTDTTETTEKIEVDGNRLIDKVKELASESRVKRLRIIEPDGDVAVDIPLTVGAIAGGAVVLAAPALAAIGAIAALVSRVRIEIIREVEETPADS